MKHMVLHMNVCAAGVGIKLCSMRDEISYKQQGIWTSCRLKTTEDCYHSALYKHMFKAHMPFF